MLPLCIDETLLSILNLFKNKIQKKKKKSLDISDAQDMLSAVRQK
jgi:hypothetical protein